MSHLDTYIIYLDDAAYAQTQLAQLLAKPHTERFILVACAPRMTRRIGKWLSHSSRENWREKWCDKLFAQFTPMIQRQDHVFCEVANGPLPEHTEKLLIDSARFINELLMICVVKGSCKKKMPASSREKYCTNVANKLSASIAKVSA